MDLRQISTIFVITKENASKMGASIRFSHKHHFKKVGKFGLLVDWRSSYSVLNIVDEKMEVLKIKQINGEDIVCFDPLAAHTNNYWMCPLRDLERLLGIVHKEAEDLIEIL